MWKVLLNIALCSFWVAVSASLASAKQGFYVGLEIPGTINIGEFDGTFTLYGLDEEIEAPGINGAFGAGVRAGYGLNHQVAVELALSSTTHSTDPESSLDSGSDDAKHRTYGLAIKWNFSAPEKTQPYIRIMVTQDELTIENAASSSSPPQVGDAIFTGRGYGLGIGIDHYFTPRISGDFGMFYHNIEYDEVEGIQEKGEIFGGISGDLFGILVGIVYHF